MTLNSSLFRSFWLAGFECSTHRNSRGERLDMTAAVQHDRFCVEDYRRLRQNGMLAARDGLRWHLIDRGGDFDWSSWIPMLEAAQWEGIQVIWDLCHYGWPDHLELFSAEFIHRFARFAAEAARVFKEHSGEIPFYVPINEISFFAWGATRGLMFPYAHGRDDELKRTLVKATIAAIDAIRQVDARARFVQPEHLIHTVPPLDQPWNTGPALAQRNSQFETWDMLTGRTAHELGGADRYFDIMGLNFYSANEWEEPGGRKLHWDAGSNDPRWMPLHRLLAELFDRYRRPLFLAETGHYGVGRAPWLKEIVREVHCAVSAGVPLEGVCLYPILDRFDWENRADWHNCGLWDLELDEAGKYRRVVNQPYADALAAAQRPGCAS